MLKKDKLQEVIIEKIQLLTTLTDQKNAVVSYKLATISRLIKEVNEETKVTDKLTKKAKKLLDLLE